MMRGTVSSGPRAFGWSNCRSPRAVIRLEDHWSLRGCLLRHENTCAFLFEVGFVCSNWHRNKVCSVLLGYFQSCTVLLTVLMMTFESMW